MRFKCQSNWSIWKVGPNTFYPDLSSSDFYLFHSPPKNVRELTIRKLALLSPVR